ncbi:MAG: hypothetical protein ACREP6_06520 [Candidatus Binataceae bacterium]
MNWNAFAIIMIFFALSGLFNFIALKLLAGRDQALQRHQLSAIKKEGSDLSRALAQEVQRLRLELPSAYVRREDWIRFGAVIDARMEIMREHMESVKEKLYGHQS